MTLSGAAPLGVDEFSADFHRHLCRDANRCLTLGVPERTAELPDPSLEHTRSSAAEAEELVLRMPARAGLDFDTALDLELAELMLRAEVDSAGLTYNGLNHREQLPTAGDDVGNGLFLLLVNDPRALAERLDDITRRLRAVPEYLHALLARLNRPIARWVAVDLEKVAGLDSLFGSIRASATGAGYSGVADLTAAIESAQRSLSSYRTALSAMPVGQAFDVGDASARQIIENRGISLSIEELHALSRRFLAENTALLDELRARLVHKYALPAETSAAELDRVLRKRFEARTKGPELEAILDRYREEHERIVEFIRTTGLFPLPPDHALEILRTPPFMEPSIPAGAMLSPAPFREGTKVSLIYLTLSEALRDEHTELGIPHMMIHEGVPGHHLQLSFAALHSSVIRRHVSAMDQAEGWTTMLEDYMLDVGYMGELADETRFMAKRELARIGARVAIDLFFMTGDRSHLDVGVPVESASPREARRPQSRPPASDPFVAAGALLQSVTGFVDERVHAELNWYSQERGYPLSYLTGNHLVWELKRDVIRSWGRGRSTAEVDKRFHEVFLGAGSMPVRCLRRVFEHHGML